MADQEAESSSHTIELEEMIEAEGGTSHTIELGELAEELQKLLPKTNTGEPVPPRVVPPRWNTTKMCGYEQLNSGSIPEEYMPSIVGLGPRLTDHICPNQKKASLAVVLQRSENELEDELKRYYNGVNSRVNLLRSAYDALDQKWQQQDDAFVRMMLIDGLFVLEVIDTVRRPDRHDNPVIKHMLEKDEDKKRCLHDILLLENQLPIVLLLILRTIQCGQKLTRKSIEKQRRELISNIIATVFIPSYNHLGQLMVRRIFNNDDQLIHALNILDVYRRCLVYYKFKKQDQMRWCGGLISKIVTAFKPVNPLQLAQNLLFSNNYNISEIIPPATKLHEAGIKFRTVPYGSKPYINISHNTLILPQIVVDSNTHSLFLNLMAFEKLHKHFAYNNEVISYVYFMGCLVDGAEDVALLQSHGIVISGLPSVEVAAIFNKTFKDSSLDPAHLNPDFENMVRRVRGRYNKMSNEWRKDLFQTYLRSPWAIMSVVAAILLFTLSIIQTVYAVLSYVRPK